MRVLGKAFLSLFRLHVCGFFYFRGFICIFQIILYAGVINVSYADMIKGMVVGAAAASAVCLYATADKRQKNKMIKCAKKTVKAMEDTVRDIVDMDD